MYLKLLFISFSDLLISILLSPRSLCGYEVKLGSVGHCGAGGFAKGLASCPVPSRRLCLKAAGRTGHPGTSSTQAEARHPDMAEMDIQGLAPVFCFGSNRISVFPRGLRSSKSLSPWKNFKSERIRKQAGAQTRGLS